MKVAIVDTYYGVALDALHAAHPEWEALGYDAHLAGLLRESFGTFNAWSRNLKPLGHDVIDIVANANTLQAKWLHERGQDAEWSREFARRQHDAPLPTAQIAAAVEQVDDFKADVVLLQDVSFFPAHVLWRWQAQGKLIAAQCSCPMPPADRLRHVDVCFTSFPHYAGAQGMLAANGVGRAEFLPLAFEPDVLTRLGEAPATRDIPIAFVGGVGKRVHWKAGTEALEAVARQFGPESFHWYGYGREYLEAGSPLLACWRGEAWGLDMYRVYQRARVVVNRHGEVAQGFTNCMRVFESVGCSAFLFTEKSPNLNELFPVGGVGTYNSPADLCSRIESVLRDEPSRELAAGIAHLEVMARHTFAQRMQVVNRVLREEVERRKPK